MNDEFDAGAAGVGAGGGTAAAAVTIAVSARNCLFISLNTCSIFVEFFADVSTYCICNESAKAYVTQRS